MLYSDMKERLKRMEGIKVSVYMLTYNHKEYIGQAIESVLMQKTDYSYELVIGDDASTDGTQDILRDYQKKYPDIIKLILRNKNIGGLKNAVDVRRHCRGEYLAVLEGDDFWIDENKLQKQIDFLEGNKDYIGCYTDCDIIKDSYYSVRWYSRRDINSLDDYLVKDGRDLLSIPTATLVFRNVYSDNPQLQKYFTKTSFIGDRIQHTILLTRGKIKYFPIKTATYRYITKTGTSYSAMDRLVKDKDFRIALKVCMCISDKEYYRCWYRQITMCNYNIIRQMWANKQYLDAGLFYLKEMNIIEKLFYIKHAVTGNK